MIFEIVFIGIIIFLFLTIGIILTWGSALIFLLFVFIMILIFYFLFLFIGQIKLNKLRRNYNVEKNISRPTGKESDFIRGRDTREEQSIKGIGTRKPETDKSIGNTILSDKSERRTLQVDDASVPNGTDKRKSPRPKRKVRRLVIRRRN